MTYTHDSGFASQSGGSGMVLSCSSSSLPPPQAASAAMSSMPSSVRTMLAVCVPAVAAAIAPVGDAQAQDTWNGRDKRVHASMSCFFGAGAAAWQRESPGKAWLIAMVPGALKEASDATTATGTGWSWKDMAANALGAGLCVHGARLVLSRSEGQAQVTFSWEY